MSNQAKNQKKWFKVLKFFAAYLVAAWTFLQFIDWVLTRYNISPYWVDILLWLFIGIIPSLLIYLYHQDRLNQGVFKRREKIVFPLNFLLLCLVIYFGFGNSDLGATTKSIEYQNEQGEQKSVLITKEEFRKGFYIFNFKPKAVDSTDTWLEFGITQLLELDLSQNKNLNPIGAGVRNTAGKVREASYFYDYYIDGEFEVIDENYSITTFIRKSETAEIITQETFKGHDVLDLIDNISVFVTDNFTSKELNAPKYLDLDVKEFTSNSLTAIKYYTQGNFTKATKEDNTFALAYLTQGKINLTFNQSKFDEHALADKAYKYRSRLPLQKQGETLILKNLVYDEFENAEKLVKLQLEVDPSNDKYNRILYNIYGRTKNLKDYTQLAYDAWEIKKNRENGFNIIEAGLIREDYNNILKQINAVSLLNPNDNYLFTLNIRPQLHKGDIASAIETQEKTKLIHPDLNNLTKVYDTAIAYLRNNKPTKEKLKKFVGTYRSNSNEQTYTYWVENNTLLQYVSNQRLTAFLLAGDNSIVSGMPLIRTWIKEFLHNESGKFYAFKMIQNDEGSSLTNWSWKIDNIITKEEKLLKTKQLDSAKTAYEEAIKANPKHYFLKDALAHINYVKSVDATTLQNQLNEVVGTYGPRKFWVENNRLFYKREQLENGRVFPTLELLPISKERYINMTKLGDHHAFKYENGKVVSSFAYQYNIENEEWIVLDDDRNLFAKDK